MSESIKGFLLWRIDAKFILFKKKNKIYLTYISKQNIKILFFYLPITDCAGVRKTRNFLFAAFFEKQNFTTLY